MCDPHPIIENIMALERKRQAEQAGVKTDPMDRLRKKRVRVIYTDSQSEPQTKQP